MNRKAGVTNTDDGNDNLFFAHQQLVKLSQYHALLHISGVLVLVSAELLT